MTSTPEAPTPHALVALGEIASVIYRDLLLREIVNRHTRLAYVNAVGRFCGWCDRNLLELNMIQNDHVSMYINELSKELSASTVRQHVSANNKLFNALSDHGVLRGNPFADVQRPRYTRNARSAVLTDDQVRRLLGAIGGSGLIELRDRAIVGCMLYMFLPVSSLIQLHIKSYKRLPRPTLVTPRKHGKIQALPCHKQVADLLESYIQSGRLELMAGGPLFRRICKQTKRLGDMPISRNGILKIVKKYARMAGLPIGTGCHSLRATGIAKYLERGGTLEMAATIADHSSIQSTSHYQQHRRVDHIESNHAVRTVLDRVIF